MTTAIHPPPSEKQNSPRGQVYFQIAERIIGLLEKGIIPWRKPWKTQSGLPRNLVTQKPYRGINIFLLHAMSYESPLWLTYRQALSLSGNVRKGEKATPVVFWKQLEIADQKTGEPGKIPLLRYYHVFNLAQCENLKNLPAPPVATPFSPPSKPDEIVAFMPKRPEIKHGLRKAYYSPAEDIVAMPDRALFETEAGYYATLFHELVHSTGHASRLNRATLTKSSGFGSDPYCKEELVAEMGATFLCAHSGIENAIIENSAAYIQNWLAQLKDDKTLMVQAAAQAQKAADFILDIKP